MNDQYDALQIMSRDYKHHFHAALDMIKRGENEKGSEYLTGLQTGFDKYELMRYCTNPVINSLLAYYTDICRSFEIIHTLIS